MQNSHNDTFSSVTGVLLAGGKSRRMGQEKALIELRGRPLCSSAMEMLRQYFATVFIAGDRPDLALEDTPSIPDIYPGSALGGLYTGLWAAGTEWIFALPCDMPYPDTRLLDQLLELREGYDAVVPLTPAGYEPIFALYSKRCLPVFEEALRQGRQCIYSLYPLLKVRTLQWQDMPEGWEKGLMNINTPEELEKIREDRP